jgi:protein-S-isoprenylcysteine O-methyltransferase Ste14
MNATGKKERISALRMIATLIYILLFPALLLYLSGDWLWVEGWIFSAWFIILCFSAILYLYFHDPDLLLERYRQPGEKNQAGWDRFVVIGLFFGFVAWIVIMPLDAKRFGWSEGFPVWVKIAGGAALPGSFFFFLRSYTDNTFLSPLVRVQTERRHQVVTTGVYGIVRHPMYLGALLLFLGTPMLLGSWWGMGTGFLMTLLLAFRIVGEEKLLRKELEGYEEYRKKVKYRLVPGIW